MLDIVHRVARLAELVPEVAELDINPLIAAPGGAHAVDVKLRRTRRPARTRPVCTPAPLMSSPTA